MQCCIKEETMASFFLFTRDVALGDIAIQELFFIHLQECYTLIRYIFRK